VVSSQILIRMKSATTIEEQIQKLRDRGMLINDEKLAHDVLLDIGYYRLGFYWFPMEKNYPNKDRRTHIFKEGSLFEMCVRLYRFDKELRHLISGYIEDLEVNLRTNVIYLLSNLYKDNPLWFVDNEVLMSQFICSLEKKYREEIINNDVIARHSKKHPEDRFAPAWKTLEYITFGDLLRLIDNLKSADAKKLVYCQYGFSDESSFPNYMEIVRQIRNDCAHGHPLFDLKLYKSLRAGKFRMVLKGDQGDLFSSLRGVLLVIQYFLFYLPGNRGTQFAIDVKNLMHRYRKDDIVDIVGYLNDVPWLKERL